MNLSFLKHKKIDQVVWLGAGDITKAELAFSPKTIVHLVDADEAIIERLHKRFKQDKNVTVHPLLISDNNNNTDFSYYSLKEFNGIAKPTALKKRYPGLKQLKTDNKPATAISTFVTNLDLLPQKNNAIILDLPGLSARLLQTLINDDTLHLFNELFVLTSQEPLFQDDSPAGDLIDLLEKNGFLCQTLQSSYQDYIVIQAELNPLYKELTESKKQLINVQIEIKQLQAKQDKEQAEANTQNQQQQEQIELLNQQKINLAQQLEQKQIDHQGQLEQVKADLTEQLQKNQQQYAKDQQELTDLNAQLQAEIKQTQTLLTTAQQESAALAQVKQTADQQFAEALRELEQVKSQQNSDLMQANKHIEEQKSQLAILNEQNAELTKANAMLEQTKKEQDTVMSEAKSIRNDLQQQVEQLTQQRNHEQKGKDDKNAENEVLTETNQSLTEELAQTRTQSNDLLKEKEVALKELDALRNQIEVLSRALDVEKQGKVKELENNNQLTLQNKELQESIQKLNGLLDQVNQGFESLESLLEQG